MIAAVPAKPFNSCILMVEKLNETDLKLKQETEKWLAKIEHLVQKIKHSSNAGLLKNMRAYISDSKHFLEKGDFIRAFECVVWAWSIYELEKEFKLFDIK